MRPRSGPTLGSASCGLAAAGSGCPAPLSGTTRLATSSPAVIGTGTTAPRIHAMPRTVTRKRGSSIHAGLNLALDWAAGRAAAAGWAWGDDVVRADRAPMPGAGQLAARCCPTAATGGPGLSPSARPWACARSVAPLPVAQPFAVGAELLSGHRHRDLAHQFRARPGRVSRAGDRSRATVAAGPATRDRCDSRPAPAVRCRSEKAARVRARGGGEFCEQASPRPCGSCSCEAGPVSHRAAAACQVAAVAAMTTVPLP